MRRRFSKRMLWLALVPLIFAGSMIQSSARCAYCKSEFRKYFDGLGATEAAVNPVERVIFSLMLANTAQTSAAQPESSHHL